MKLGKIQTLKLCDVFDGEASHFTPWLVDNINELGDALGLTLSDPEREQRQTTFRVDIVASVGEDQDEKIAIENQFGRSDHSHIGQLVTYAASVGARYAAWVVEDVHEEHVRAVQFLNEIQADAPEQRCFFFLVKAGLWRIDDSLPAPLFDVVVKPERDYGNIQESGYTKEETQRLLFWSLLLQGLDSNRQPTTQHWMDFACGKSDRVHYTISLRKHSVILRITLFSSDKNLNKSNFDLLHDHKDEMEAAFENRQLVWRRMDDNRMSTIDYTLNDAGGYSQDESNYARLVEETAAQFNKFKEATKAYVDMIQ